MLSTFETNNPYQPKRQKKMSSVVVIVLITVVILAAVTQLDKIREFFSKASGQPANIVIDTQAVLGPVPRPWRNLAQGGEGHDWQLAPIVNQVKALHPEYIRIDHLYDFYEIVGGTSGNLTFNFAKLDPILDAITATGAKPFISLSYMPPAISRGDIVDQPSNWADWQLTVQRTIEHISGTKKISDVYYEVWNEPDLFGKWNYYGSKSYLTLYSYSAMGAKQAKNVLPFKLGGPAITALYKNWFQALAKHALNNNLKFDFFSWHRYSHDLERFEKDFIEIRGWKARYPALSDVELLITEWGPDSNNHPGYDTGYSGAHAVATSIMMMNAIDRGFVFEIQDGKDPQGQANWGRWGLLTHADFGSKTKPRYQALQFLDQISNQRLSLTGQGSWVKAVAARNPRLNTEILLVNFDPKGTHSENVPVTFTNIEPGNYQVLLQFFGGRSQTISIATSAASLQINIPIPVNNLVKVELKPI